MAKKDNIKLERLAPNEQGIVLDMIRNDEGLQETFSGNTNTVKRVANSAYTALIKKDKTDIGFIMLVANDRTDKFEIDMGILEEFRGDGYGSQALAKLKQIIENNPEKLDVEIQTSRMNEPAIRSIVKNGFKLYREDKNYYYFKLPEETMKHK